MENKKIIKAVEKEQAKFINYVEQIENIGSEYQIEDMGNESQEQEYLKYIDDKCIELKELINTLYEIKLNIIKNK